MIFQEHNRDDREDYAYEQERQKRIDGMTDAAWEQLIDDNLVREYEKYDLEG